MNRVVEVGDAVSDRTDVGGRVLILADGRVYVVGVAHLDLVGLSMAESLSKQEQPSLWGSRLGGAPSLERFERRILNIWGQGVSLLIGLEGHVSFFRGSLVTIQR